MIFCIEMFYTCLEVTDKKKHNSNIILLNTLTFVQWLYTGKLSQMNIKCEWYFHVTIKENEQTRMLCI